MEGTVCCLCKNFTFYLLCNVINKAFDWSQLLKCHSAFYKHKNDLNHVAGVIKNHLHEHVDQRAAGADNIQRAVISIHLPVNTDAALPGENPCRHRENSTQKGVNRSYDLLAVREQC